MMLGSRDTTSNNKGVSDTIVVVVISTFILSLTMLLRLYTRLRVMKKFSWEDGKSLFLSLECDGLTSRRRNLWLLCKFPLRAGNGILSINQLLIVPIISLSVPAVRLGILRKSHEVSRHNASQLSKVRDIHHRTDYFVNSL